MAKKGYSQDDYDERVELANSISIVDYARKIGMEIIHEDESIAISIDEDTDHELIIYKETNTWRLSKESELGDKDDIVYGNTIRFAARQEKIHWKDAIEELVTDRVKYMSAEEYNAAFEKQKEINLIPEAPKVNKSVMNREAAVADTENIMNQAPADKTQSQENQLPNDNVKVSSKQSTISPSQFQTDQSPVQKQVVNFNNDMNNMRGINTPIPNPTIIPFPQLQHNGYRRTFTKEQMSEILAGIKRGLNVVEYDNVQLRPEQMKQIRMGLQNGIDPKAYNFPFVSAEYMKEVRLAIQEGLDISLLEIRNNKCIFSPDQAHEIRKGLENGLAMNDINLYARPYLPPEAMKEIRLGLQDGFQQMRDLNAGNYSAKDLHTIRITLTINKMIEAIAAHAKDLFEKIISLVHKIIEKNLYTSKETSEEYSNKYLDPNREVLHELKDAVTHIYTAMEESLEELPEDQKVIKFTEAIQRVASRAEVMEHSIDADPTVIMVQSIQEIVDAQTQFALQQKAYDNLREEYMNDFNSQEESYNIKHVEFSTKVMTDQSLTEEQKVEIIKETLGSMYGESVAHIWTERIAQESKLLQEQTRVKMVAFEQYEQQQYATVQMEELDYGMEP
jgi:hypothetical protein